MKRSARSGLVYLLFLLALAGLTSNAAWADAGEYKNYARGGVGIHQYRSDLENAGYDDTGFALDAAYGRYLAKHLVIEGSAGYLYTDQDFSGSTGTAGSYTRDDEISVGSLLVTLKAELPVGPVTFFGGGGVGVYFVTLESDIETANLGDFDVDDDDTLFGVHVVAGGYHNITERIFVGLEGLYRWTDDVEINKTTGTVPVRLNGDLDGFSVTMTGGFRF
jgi:opacity protein-like surface antigen